MLTKYNKTINKVPIHYWTNNINNVEDGAYKDIDEVMENQKNLVRIVVKLKPIVVVKG